MGCYIQSTKWKKTKQNWQPRILCPAKIVFSIEEQTKAGVHHHNHCLIRNAKGVLQWKERMLASKMKWYESVKPTVLSLVAQSCLKSTRLLCQWGFSRQEYRSGLSFPSPRDCQAQESVPGLLHCRQILYQLRYEGSPNWKALKVFQQRLNSADWARSENSYLGKVLG